eukprot:6186758-Pleurochrysis_carterae.AAC.4
MAIKNICSKDGLFCCGPVTPTARRFPCVPIWRCRRRLASSFLGTTHTTMNGAPVARNFSALSPSACCVRNTSTSRRRCPRSSRTRSTPSLCAGTRSKRKSILANTNRCDRKGRYRVMRSDKVAVSAFNALDELAD